MSDRPAVSGVAYAISRHPQPLSMLDTTPFDSQHPERYWSDLADLTALLDALSEIGCMTRSVTHNGVWLTARPQVLEQAFDVSLHHSETPHGPVWKIIDRSGAECPAIMPNRDLAQWGLLDGIAIDLPERPHMVPTFEIRDKEASAAKRGAHCMYPHMLRRRLSKEPIDVKKAAALPTGQTDEGKPVEIVVIDSGWNFTEHPYWKEAGLYERLRDNVRLFQDQEALELAKKGFLQDLQSSQNPAYALQNKMSALLKKIPKPTKSPSEFFDELLGIIAEHATFIEKPSRIVEFNQFSELAKSLKEQDSAKVSYLSIERYADEVRSEIDRFMELLVQKYSRLPDKLPKDDYATPADRSSEHGTLVVSQIISVAPDTKITVVQKNFGNQKELSAIFGDYSYLTMKSGYEILENSLISTVGPKKIYNCSFGTAMNFQKLEQKSEYEINLFKRLSLISAYLENKGSLVVFSSNNSSTAKKKEDSVPPKVGPESRFQSDNLMIAGSAYWDTNTPQRKLYPEKTCVGYFDDRKFASRGRPESDDPIISPTICGLSAGPNGVGLMAFPVSIAKKSADGANPQVSYDHAFAIANGTSFAAPQIAGAAALVAGVLGKVDPPRITEFLKSTMASFTGTGDFKTPDWAKSVLYSDFEGQKPGLVDLRAATVMAKYSVRPLPNPLLPGTFNSEHLPADDDTLEQSYLDSESLGSLSGSDGGFYAAFDRGSTSSDEDDDFDSSPEPSETESDFIWPDDFEDDDAASSAEGQGPLPPLPTGINP